MQMSDTRRIEAPPDAVFAALTDADILRASIPGCQEMSGSVENGFEATVKQKVGPVSATFKGNVAVEDVDAPRSLRLSGEGKGGPAGFAKGSANVTLTPEDAGTRLSYDVDAKVGGKLAQLGGRVIDGVAKKMADQFFDNFKNAVEAEGSGTSDQRPPETVQHADASEPVVEEVEPQDPTPPDAVENKKKGMLGRLFG